MSKAILKSIGAILAGMIFVIVLSLGTDFILQKAGIFPPPEQGLYTTWKLVLAIAYRSVYSIAGSYLTATLAPNHPMRHSIISGIIGLAISILGVIVTWDKGLGPAWYGISLAVLALPCAWIGGKLKLSN